MGYGRDRLSYSGISTELIRKLHALVVCTARAADYLDVNIFHMIALELLPGKARFQEIYRLIIYDILERVVHMVIEMHVLESIDVEIHLVVRTHPVVIYSER